MIDTIPFTPRGDIYLRFHQAIQRGRVLDLSRMSLDNGTGIKTVHSPGATSRKIWVQGLPIVSSVIKNYFIVVRHLFQIYFDDDGLVYLQEYWDKYRAIRL